MPRRVSESLTRPLKEQHHFPFKLYDMLECVANSQYSLAVSWSEDGRAFVVSNKAMLLEYVLPIFFQADKVPLVRKSMVLFASLILPKA